MSPFERKPRPEPLWRVLASRGGMLLVGLPLTYGALRLLIVLYRALSEVPSGGNSTQRVGVPILLWIAGIIAAVMGILITVAALTPTKTAERIFERFNRPPRTGDRDLGINDTSARWWYWWYF